MYKAFDTEDGVEVAWNQVELVGLEMEKEVCACICLGAVGKGGGWMHLPGCKRCSDRCAMPVVAPKWPPNHPVCAGA